MARIGVAITKSTAFREAVQEFNNVYYYENGGGLPSVGQAEALIDALVALEKTWHSTGVTFVRARLWSQVGTAAQNNMLFQKNLSGTGITSLVAAMDKERAVLVRWRAGVDSRGNPVYLRKWIHSCGNPPGGPAVATDVLANTAAMPLAARTTIENAVNPCVQMAEGGGPWNLVSKSGRQRDTGFGLAHRFLEHHQLGDMWR